MTDEDTIIRVLNNGEEVFNGLAYEFLKDNEMDEDVQDMVTDAATHGMSKRLFFSGVWEVKRVDV